MLVVARRCTAKSSRLRSSSTKFTNLAVKRWIEVNLEPIINNRYDATLRIPTTFNTYDPSQSAKDPEITLSFEEDISLLLKYAELKKRFASKEEAEKLEQILFDAKGNFSEIAPKTLEKLFFFYLALGDKDRCFVHFVNHKQIEHPNGLMCLGLMILGAQDNDAALIKTGYHDFAKNVDSLYTRWVLNIILKAFVQLGDMPTLLTNYEKLYISGVPQKREWQLMLKGAARCGDPKHFGRFLYRLIKKGARPSKAALQALIQEWGASENWNWKLSKACNMKVYDYVYAVDAALRVHNYEKATQFMQDVYKLDKQPTVQLFEAFLFGVNRDFPALRAEASEWKRLFQDKYGTLDHEIVTKFEKWVEKVKDYIGRDNLANPKLPPHIPKPPKRPSRKVLRENLGVGTPKERYVSEFTDPTKLFEFVPYYFRRLERESEEYKLKVENEKKRQKIEKEIETARARAERARTRWNVTGFHLDMYPEPRDSRDKLHSVQEMEQLERRIREHYMKVKEQSVVEHLSPEAEQRRFLQVFKKETFEPVGYRERRKELQERLAIVAKTRIETFLKPFAAEVLEKHEALRRLEGKKSSMKFTKTELWEELLKQAIPLLHFAPKRIENNLMEWLKTHDDEELSSSTYDQENQGEEDKVPWSSEAQEYLEERMQHHKEKYPVDEEEDFDNFEDDTPE